VLFYFTFPFGYSAYASQFLICVTMKEENQSKMCCKVESNHRISIKCWKKRNRTVSEKLKKVVVQMHGTELNRIRKNCEKVVLLKKVCFEMWKTQYGKDPCWRFMSYYVEKSRFGISYWWNAINIDNIVFAYWLYGRKKNCFGNTPSIMNVVFSTDV